MASSRWAAGDDGKVVGGHFDHVDKRQTRIVQPVDDVEIVLVADLGVLAPRHRVIYAGIRMLFHIVQRKRADLLSLLFAGKEAPKSWYRNLISDLTWVAASSKKLELLGHAGVGGWTRFFSVSGI